LIESPFCIEELMSVTLKTDQTPWKVIPLRYCTVSFYEFWAWTEFPDGCGYGAFPDYDSAKPFWPNFTDDYREVAAFAGYDDPLLYCLEHEFFHSLIAERVFDKESGVLWALAHSEPPPLITVHEESATILFQRFFQGEKMFATSPRVDWFAIRDDAKRLLAV
jgi:hypothetical protein